MIELNKEETIRVTAVSLAISSTETVTSASQLIARANRIEKFIKEGVKENGTRKPKH